MSGDFMSKIMFFTAGTVATEPEKTAIAALNGAKNEVVVRNKTADPKYAATRETTDFVAGDVPAVYNDVAVWASQGIVSNGVDITPLPVKIGAAADANYTVTPTVVNGVITKLTLVAL
jgi:hypothetical protein